LSPYHVIRIFRKATGLPPYTYFEQLRIERAIDLLRRGVPISDVAVMTGFSDQSHLTRRFKRVVGVPPGKYARSLVK
jgi:AraC-like DNA-binding protein